MDFSLNDEQTELSKTLHQVLSKHASSAQVRQAAESELGYDPELWELIAQDIGVCSLPIPETYSGAGCSWLETGLVLEALGDHLAPSPLLASGVLATAALLESGNEEACQRLLPQLAEGQLISTLAWAGPDGTMDPAGGSLSAQFNGGWTLEGTARLVLNGHSAHSILAVARTPQGPALFEVTDPAALKRDRTSMVDSTLQTAEIQFSSTAANLLLADAGHALEKIRDIALAALACSQAGTARRALDMTVEYTQQRTQFGRPIGSFQALKHRMADMLVQVETARTAAWTAAWAAGTGQDVEQRSAWAAAWCTKALGLVAAECVQLHGGIAITWEHDAQMVFKRAHATGQLFGSARSHRRRLAGMLGLSPASRTEQPLAV